MPGSLRDSAAAAVAALQQWHGSEYGSDSYASSTGLYHWDDPNFANESQAGLITAAGYANAFQDMTVWWDSANAITALIDYMLITGDMGPNNSNSYLNAIEQTFDKAQTAYMFNQSAAITGAAVGAGGGAVAGAAVGSFVAGPVGALVGAGIGGVIGAFGGGAAAAATIARIYLTNFMNPNTTGPTPGLYDDEAWWALAWIKAYDLTTDVKYLNMAELIFTDMTSGWDTNACGGGIYWKKDHGDDSSPPNSPYKNAIANELFLALAAGLYLRTQNPDYLKWANWEWQWFQQSGLINSDSLINDSLTTSADQEGPCVNNHTKNVWSYNQGVILGALSDMYKITGLVNYLDTAQQIANAFIRNPVLPNGKPPNPASPNGKPPESGVDSKHILKELSDFPENTTSIGSCQYKGIFVRNLGYLYATTHNPSYGAFLRRNTAAALDPKNTNDSNQFGSRWDQPIDLVDFVRQSSAVDLLNATLRVQSFTPNLQSTAPDLSYLEPLLLSP